MPDPIDKLAWLHVRERRLLGARSRGRATWYVPGGKREPGESDEDALLREIREELTIDLVPATIARVGTFTAQADGKPAGTQVAVTCYRAEPVGEPQAAAEIEALRWFVRADRELCSPAMQQILDWLHAHDAID